MILTMYTLTLLTADLNGSLYLKWNKKQWGLWRGLSYGGAAENFFDNTTMEAPILLCKMDVKAFSYLHD